MFLNLLNEREGKDFLELALIAMKIDGKTEESEENIFTSFKNEMGLFDYQATNKEYDDIVNAFKESTKQVRKAVIIEITGILDADGIIQASESSWVRKLGEDLEFRESEIRKMVRWVQDFNDLLLEGYEYINR